jgi:hypothetical protein
MSMVASRSESPILEPHPAPTRESMVVQTLDVMAVTTANLKPGHDCNSIGFFKFRSYTMADQVVDAVVRSIIHASLAKEPTRSGETIVHRVSRAFRALQKRRREVEPLNINLAAAEHYMYARFLAGLTGDPTVRLAPTLYGLKKRLYFALGIQDKMATTGNPVLPPNSAVEHWGKVGATDGLTDYTRATKSPANRYGSAVATLSQEAWRYN